MFVFLAKFGKDYNHRDHRTQARSKLDGLNDSKSDFEPLGDVEGIERFKFETKIQNRANRDLSLDDDNDDDVDGNGIKAPITYLDEMVETLGERTKRPLPYFIEKSGSVTRFGEISPLWQKSANQPIFYRLFLIWQNAEPNLANL